ncbi:hypothetical protein M569_03452, partial [Genlisea aurea]
ISISGVEIPRLITHRSLINHLQKMLPMIAAETHSPLRHIHRTGNSSSFILMPSWSTSPLLPYIGAKLVTHHSGNSAVNLPGVHAVYALFESLTGRPLAFIDATELTLYRTACVSALASSYLSREDSATLVAVGAGALAPHLVKAHLIVRPNIKRILVWNRTHEKAGIMADNLRKDPQFRGISVECVSDLEEAVRSGDIITCATNSEVALVKGVDLKKGAHLDLVGSFTPAMRECDEEAVRRGRVFVDTEAAAVEAGELAGAVDVVEGELVDVVKGEKKGRMNSEEITVFKSVGSAMVDLLAAQIVYENYTQQAI